MRAVLLLATVSFSCRNSGEIDDASSVATFVVNVSTPEFRKTMPIKWSAFAGVS